MNSVWNGMTVFVVAVALGAIVPAAGAEERELKFSDVPAAVQKTFREESQGVAIASVRKETEDGKTAYRADVVIGGTKYGVVVDEGGTLTEMGMEPDEDEVKFSACTAAARKTFQEESKHAAIEVVAKDLRYGMPVYQTVVAVAGKNYEIVVAENGTLVEKTLVVAEDDVELTACPAAVQKALKAESRGGKIGDVTRSTGLGGHVYEAEAEIGGRRYSIEVTEAGKLIVKSLAEAE